MMVNLEEQVGIKAYWVCYHEGLSVLVQGQLLIILWLELGRRIKEEGFADYCCNDPSSMTYVSRRKVWEFLKAIDDVEVVDLTVDGRWSRPCFERD